jgi:3-deoxy-D-manno-octulosonic-acid transferase
MLAVYNFFLALYRVGIGMSALYNSKAALWIEGRKNWQNQLSTAVKENEKRIWIHCSSLGEFEQGRPLIELLKQQYPTYKIMLTFFSPSGYEACKNYKGADTIMYLPLDSKKNAETFITISKPALAIFVKYEFWHYYLNELKAQKIPTLVIASAFRKEQAFFKWYGGFFRKMLSCFTQIHVQDSLSAQLLQHIGYDENVIVTGDTRYDRVSAISAGIRTIREAEIFKGSSKVLIAGSTWPEDEEVLHKCISTLPDDWKLIIAPHEIHSKHIQQIVQLFGKETILFSQLDTSNALYNKRILIIDNIGMLSSLYAYGDIAYVGGGFQKGGIHNTLEPAVFGIPVVIGPVYRKFVEAVSLVKAGAVFPAKDEYEAKKIIAQLVSDNQLRNNIRIVLQQFMKDNTGATARILTAISNNKLL